MYLKHLKINGFKSFGKEIIFTFDKNLNIIVGPNGSGKSNVIDAVKWLFGEAKYKSIRLEHPDSVLFNGNDRLSPAKTAKVEMIIDNSDGELDDFDREISIMRTYRKGDSKYYLNGKRVNLKEIKSFISDKGLGREFYSVISQGKITELVKSGGKSMKKLLDQAAGIVPFYQKKDQALKNLEQTQQNLLRIGDIIKEISSRKNTLHLQAKRAEKYLEYKRLLNNLKATKILKSVNLLQKDLDTVDADILEISNLITDKEELLKSKKAQLEDYRQKYSKIDALMQELTSTIDSLRDKEKDFNLKYNKINTRISDASIKRDGLTYQINSNKEKISELENDLKKNQSLLDSLSLELKKAQEEYKKVESERKSLTGLVDEIQKRNYEVQEEIFKLKSQLSDMNSTLTSRDQRLKTIDEDIEKVKSEIENNNYKIAQSKEKMKLYSEKIKKYDSLDEELKKSIMQKEVLLNNLKHRFEDINSQLNKLNLELSSLKEKYNMNSKWLNSYEGYSRAVKVLFREAKKIPDLGLIDTVANILKPLPGYELAINALISGRLQNVLTVSSSDAKQCIELLRRLKAGRITFLPLDLIEGNLYSSLRPEQSIDFARNLVEYDKRYEKIINFLFTNSIVVEDISIAINLKKSGYKGRISTLKGELIQPGGAITGGSADEHSLNLMNRQNIIDEIESQMKEIESEMDKKTIELSKVSIQMNEASDAIRDLKSKGSEYRTDYDRLKNQLELYSEMISTYEANIDKSKKKFQGLEKLRPSLEGEMEDIKSKLSYIKNLIAEKEQSREKIKSEMDEIVEKYRKVDAQTSEKKRVFDELNGKYESIEGQIERITQEKSKLEELIVQDEIQLKELNKTIDSLNDDLFYIKQDISKIKKDIDDKINEMKSNSNLKTKGAELLQTLRNEVKDIEDNLNSLKDKSRDLELKRKEYQVKLEDLKLSLDEIEYDEVYEDRKDIEDSIKDLENKLKHIGTVNLNAFEEYKEVSKRYEDYEKQKNDIVLAKEKIELLINKLDEEAKKKFIDSLENIQSYFNEMMELLFNGGGGEIILTSPDNVLETEVDINVKVPHKKIKSLYAMSGGEQTLIGVALMFAFLKTNPSPFYILDEIDANLDSANTERISTLLKGLSKNTQFIVITHNKIMMDVAKTIYGITMEKGLTKAIRVNI